MTRNFLRFHLGGTHTPKWTGPLLGGLCLVAFTLMPTGLFTSPALASSSLPIGCLNTTLLLLNQNANQTNFYPVVRNNCLFDVGGIQLVLTATNECPAFGGSYQEEYLQVGFLAKGQVSTPTATLTAWCISCPPEGGTTFPPFPVSGQVIEAAGYRVGTRQEAFAPKTSGVAWTILPNNAGNAGNLRCPR